MCVHTHTYTHTHMYTKSLQLCQTFWNPHSLLGSFVHGILQAKY